MALVTHLNLDPDSHIHLVAYLDRLDAAPAAPAAPAARAIAAIAPSARPTCPAVSQFFVAVTTLLMSLYHPFASKLLRPANVNRRPFVITSC